MESVLPIHKDNEDWPKSKMESLEETMGNVHEETQACPWLANSYPPSVAPIDKLKKVFLEDMRADLHHRGSYILIQIADCLPFRGGVIVADDEKGNVVAVRILHQDGKQIYNEYWGNAKFLIIKEPFLEAVRGSSMCSITVHHVTDVLAISPGDPRLPMKWHLCTVMTADVWRQVGNKAVREKQFYQAIDCYNNALLEAGSKEDMLTIRLNRCYARISVQCFDTALQDSSAVLAGFPDKEKALFREAEALYGLRRFKEAEKVLRHMIVLFPGNETACQRMDRVGNRLQEEAGVYDFAGMLRENLKPVKSDRAGFIGPVEVRSCRLKSHGRGLFLTKAVKAGQLLLCEKAFSVSLMSINEDVDEALSGHELEDARNDLHNDCVFQFHRNPSLFPAFRNLYSGYYSPKESIEVEGQVIIDGFMIHAVVGLNCYKYLQSRDFHRGLAHAEPDLLYHPMSAGLWIQASYINHSCLPNVERAFIGDMIIIRAAKDLDAGSELAHSYVSLLKGYEDRQNGLKDYAFQCTCRRCRSDESVPADRHEKRNEILKVLELENRTLAISNEATPLKRFENLLDEFDNTYTITASELPRPEIYMDLFISIRNFYGREMFSEVVTLVRRLLLASGFHLRISQKRFRIMQWGSLSDLTVASIAYLWKAYGSVNLALCDDVEEVLKTAYEIVVGERSSFEGVYGALRPPPKVPFESAGSKTKRSKRRRMTYGESEGGEVMKG